MLLNETVVSDFKFPPSYVRTRQIWRGMRTISYVLYSFVLVLTIQFSLFAQLKMIIKGNNLLHLERIFSTFILSTSL
jgi:hypothetical protein